MEEPILLEDRAGVLIVTLNRPHRRNAFDERMSIQLGNAMEVLDATPALQCAVLTGADGGFSAGMDLKAFAAGESARIADRGFAGITRRGPEKPLIAAIEGFALAGGLEVALACDLIVCTRDARLGIPEVKRGLVAAGGGLLRLPRRLPYHVAMELALTGEDLDPSRGAELGLINRVVEPGAALEIALELAGVISLNAPLGVRVSKAVISRQTDWPSTLMWDLQDSLAGPVLASEDAREGATAFAERRRPVWRGR